MTEYNNEDEIKCPYCGYEEGDSWEVNNSDDDYECMDCGKKFVLTIEHSVSYSTKKQSCKNDKHELVDTPKHVMIFDTNWDYKTDIRTKKPKEEWEYAEYYPCKNCDEEERVLIKEEAYKKKYPYKYEITMKYHGLFAEDKEVAKK